jgi:hypothetical protein
MTCRHCGSELAEEALQCPVCGTAVADEAESAANLEVLIRTGLRDPIAINLMKSLLQEAGIPFFSMDQNVAARQESGNFIGWWNFRVPAEHEADAREILKSVEDAPAPADS